MASFARWYGMKFVCGCCQRDQSKTSHCKTIANLIMDTFELVDECVASKPVVIPCMDDGCFSFSSIFGEKSCSLDGCNVFDWSAADLFCQIPKTCSWPAVWFTVIDNVRSAGVPLFWEIFAGSAALTGAFTDSDWTCGPPIDFRIDECFSVLDPQFFAIIIGLILEGRFSLVSLTPPYHCGP